MSAQYKQYHFKVILIVHLICFCLPSFAVLNDSLLIRFKDNPADEDLNKLISEKVFKNIYEDPDRAISYANEVLRIANAYKQHETATKMLMYAGIAYDYKGEYDSAFSKYDRGIEIAEKNQLHLLKGDLYNNYSITLSIKGEMGEAIEYALNALAIFEQSGDSTRLAKIYNSLGSRYSEIDFEEIALNYYLKAAAINEIKNDTRRLVYNFGNIGLLYHDLGDYENALLYISKSLDLQDTVNNRLDYSTSLHHLALVYQNMEQYDEALAYEQRAYNIAKEIDDDLGMISILRGLAAINKDTGDPEKALDDLEEAMKLARETGARSFLVNIYEDISEVYADLHQYQEAFRYKSLYNLLKDSLQWVEKNKALAIIQQFETDKKQREIQLLTKDSEIQKLNIRRQKAIKNSVGIVGILLLILAVLVFHRYRYVRRTNNELAEKNLIINNEKDRSDKLLLNILPAETAEELKLNGFAEARQFDMVTVLFTDFVGFTKVSETLSAKELVNEIDHCYKNFDRIISDHHIEKIKTIGDSYMCAGGLPVPNTTNPADTVKAALRIQQFMLDLKAARQKAGQPCFEIRIGVHTGPVIAGVVGTKKYQYDIWGDTVNLASRMESSGEPGKVNISQTTWQHVKEQFRCVYRGKIVAKNKGSLDMYFVENQAALSDQ
jgi:adenylate cyclase